MESDLALAKDFAPLTRTDSGSAQPAKVFKNRFNRFFLGDKRRPLPPPLRLVTGLGLLAVVGTLILMLPGIGRGDPLSWNEALFTAMSALSVTGLSIIQVADDLTLFGQIVLLILIQIGGVGFMVLAVVVFQLMGRRISLLNRLALCNSLGLIDPGAILALTRKVLLSVTLIELGGALLLWVHWRDLYGPDRAIFLAIFHAVSAFCNAGFDLFGTTGIPTDNLSLTILAALIFIGGLGIPVLSDLLTWPRSHRLSLHTRITLGVVMVLLCTGGIGMFLGESLSGGSLLEVSWPRRLGLTFFQSVSARTAGFAGIPIQDLAPPSQLLLIALMFIGAAPASMGGGITTGTFAVLVLALWGYARGLPSAQIAGRSLDPSMVRKAAAVLTVSLFVVLLAAWLILMSHSGSRLDPVLFEVISAFATCGLSTGFTADLNLFGQLIIVLVMFWGRLGALTIVLALAQQQPRQLVIYPEEPILIG
ncbi:potassium transporter [Synechococcus sp. Nb3U1]|uniref:TrkH family potassium uptake protein n=1 Tax=Synechococcus sp. Nb3U1 TaxID=1914529 RepID=UPI001F3CB080|nr:potassium transporter TrkG [Synechococcus sp. Nb3U1]MCF2971043.1 potassium transporter [Synechococcus sp. Nb3U1]